MSRLALLVLTLCLSPLSLAQEAAPFDIENVESRSVHWNGRSVVIDDFDSRRPPKIKFKKEPATGSARCTLNDREISCSSSSGVPIAHAPVRGVQRHQLQLTSQSGIRKYELQLLPNDFPEYRVEGSSGLSYPIMFSPIRSSTSAGVDYKAGHLLILSPKGDTIFYKRVGALSTDFRPHLIGGREYYSYSTQNAHNNLRSAILGDRFLLNDRFEVIEVLKGINIHDFGWLGKKHYVVIKELVARNDQEKLYENSRIQEIKDDRVRFDFGISDLIAAGVGFERSIMDLQNSDSVEFLGFINSMQMIGSQMIFVGTYNNGAFLLDLKEKKSLKWIFGGASDQFSIPTDFRPFPWHAPVWDRGRGSILVFDNGSESKEGQRALEFDVDVNKRKILGKKVIFASGFPSNVFGSVERDGDTHSIGLGSTSSSFVKTERPKGQPIFVEVVGGKPTMKVFFADGKDSTFHNYRSYRLRHGSFQTR